MVNAGQIIVRIGDRGVDNMADPGLFGRLDNRLVLRYPNITIHFW